MSDSDGGRSRAPGESRFLYDPERRFNQNRGPMRQQNRRIARTIACGLIAGALGVVAPSSAQTIFRLGVPKQHTVSDGRLDYGVQCACMPGGPFVLSWISQGATQHQVVARVFAFDGTPLTAELPVSTASAGIESPAFMAADASNNFVVVWPFPDGDGSGNPGVRYRVFSSAGVGSPEAAANSHAAGAQDKPRVARRATGEFVIVWSGVGPGSVTGIWMRRFDATGAPLAVEALVEAGAVDSPSIAMRPSTGDFVIAWQTTGGDENIRARRFDSSGAAVGGIFDVNTSTAGEQRDPDVAMAGDGSFVVLFRGNGQGDPDGALGQLYDAAGATVGGEFWVNGTITGFVDWASAAFLSDGSFAVVFDIGDIGVRYRTHVARYSPLAVRDGFSDFPLTPELPLDRLQFATSLCADGPATFRVPFQEGPYPGEDEEVLTQRLSFGLFADGFESEDTAAWSSAVP